MWRVPRGEDTEVQKEALYGERRKYLGETFRDLAVQKGPGLEIIRCCT